MEVQKKTEVSAMKKLFSLVLVLCLLCAGAALAEVATEETTLELEGFTLTLKPGEVYQRTENPELGKPYLMVFPLVGENDYSTNYGICSVNVPEGYNAEGMKKEIASFEEDFRTGMAAQNIQVEAIEVKEPWDDTLNEKPCTTFGYSTTIKSGDISMKLFARSIVVSSVNTNFIITASSEEILERVTQQLSEVLHFQ